MNKTKIDWCDWTWNPVTGCFHGCEYCYARSQAWRFGGHWDDEKLRHYGGDGTMHELEKRMYRHTTGKNREKPVHEIYAPFPYVFDPTFHRYRLDEPSEMKDPQRIFVVSMGDLFGEWVPDEWIKEVFEACTAAPQHTYMFLTKNPNRYYQLGEGDEAIIPDEGIAGWFGASASTEEQAKEAYQNTNCMWMSLEPLHGEFSEEFFTHWDMVGDGMFDEIRRWHWIVIGAETGNRKDKITPKREWIEDIVNSCKETETPLFMKSNLAEIWAAPLIQQYPEGQREVEPC